MERINIQNISKKFDIGFRKKEGALFRLVSLVSGKENRREIQALKDISFSVKAGENIGIIGRNGSGKSTLLKIIAEIYFPDHGQIQTDGQLIYLNGFGPGLKPKLTIRENIFLVGSLIGLSPKEIRSKFEEIVEFSGLRDYLDTKVYQLSSGMVARLNFSISIHCLLHRSPEILLLDEVFNSGGDLEFQAKAVAKMEQLIQGGATVILVSHDLDLIAKYCDRTIWLDKGEVTEIAESKEVISHYEKSVNHR